MLIHSLDSAAALMPHISALVDPPPANSLLCPNMKFEPRRWRPPHHGGGSRRIVCYTINEKVQTNVTQYSPSYGLMHTQSAVPPAALQGWVEPLHHWNAELSWRARRKPPNVLGLFPQHSISSINANDKRSVDGCLPKNGTVRMLSVATLAEPVQGEDPCRPGHELVWRMRKLPDSMLQQHLQDAVSKAEEGIGTICLKGLPTPFGPITCGRPGAAFMLLAHCFRTRSSSWPTVSVWHSSPSSTTRGPMKSPSHANDLYIRKL
jgi:hypothetical protein